MISSDTNRTQKSMPTEASSTSSAWDWTGQYTISNHGYTYIDKRSYSITQEALTSDFPWIEHREFTGGVKAVIRGTRIPVSTIIGYIMLGESIEAIQHEILPSINAEQILEAIRYFAEHRAEIAKEIAENQEQVVRSKLAPFV